MGYEVAGLDDISILLPLDIGEGSEGAENGWFRYSSVKRAIWYRCVSVVMGSCWLLASLTP